MSAAPALRQYQVDSLEAICAAREAGANRLLIKIPTGGGKTQCFASLLRWPRIVSWLETLPKQKGATMLVVAHREELLTQAQHRIEQLNPGAIVSIEQGEKRANRYSDVVVASIQTLSAMKFRRLERLQRHHSFRVVIVDEAHHTAAASYRTMLAHLNFLPMAVSKDGDAEAATYDDVKDMETALLGWDAQAPKDRLLIGVTATPNRSDAIGLGCCYQEIAYNYALKQAIKDGWLVPIVPKVVESSENLDGVKIVAGDFQQKALAKAVNVERRNQLALAAWREVASDRPTIGFTVDVAHAHAMADLFTANGITAVAISGETPKPERRASLEAYTAGRISVIFNCQVLTEGTDLPRTSCIVHLAPTKSSTLYEQKTGRGLRLFPGKTDCLVIDVVDIARKHSLQTAPVLVGLPPGLKPDGGDLTQLEKDYDAFREAHPNLNTEALLAAGRLSLAELRAKIATFNIWEIQPLPADLKAISSMSWVGGGDEFRLQYPWGDGTETVVVRKDMLGHWEISCTLRPRQAHQPIRQRTLGSGLETAAGALTMAEAFMTNERLTATRITNREARWRRNAPSPAARAFAQRLGIQVTPGMLAGQVSDLIDQAKARRGMR